MFTRLLPFCFTLGLIVGAASPLPAEERPHTGGTRVKVHEGLLSVELEEETAVGDILRAIGERAGVQVRIGGNPGRIRPQAFEELPLTEGIRRLVVGARLVMLYASDDTGVRRLVEVRVYGPSGAATIRPADHRQPRLAARLPPPPPQSRFPIPAPPPPPSPR